MPDNNQEASYTKSPLKTVLIYLGIGILVYGLVYYVAFKKKDKPMENSAQENANVENVVDLPEVQAEVSLTQTGFSPDEVTVSAGTMVTWTNNSGETATINSAKHPGHEDYPALNLGEIQDGDSMSLAFPEAGTYQYHNHLNPTQTGTVIVE